MSNAENRDRFASLTEEQIVLLLKDSHQNETDKETSRIIQPAHISRRKAAVFVPLLKINEAWELLFIKRTDAVRDHKNQVAFPGGVSELADPSIRATALREMNEEIGVNPEDVMIFGEFDEPIEVTNYFIYPVVGTFPWPYSLVLSAEEVDHVFSIPLRWLADKNNWESRLFERDGLAHPVIFYQPYKDEILWGASARIVVDLVEVLHLA